MDKKKLYAEAYRILNNSTPLRMDCGVLCGKACCGGDDETGMYLFPGEEALLEASGDFLRLLPSNIVLQDGKKVLLAVCQGRCLREWRPLACRIFPLTPYVTENDILTLTTDPRAEGRCPIVLYAGRRKLDQDFVRNVRSVCRLLAEDEEIKGFLKLLSRLLDEYAAVKRQFSK